MKVYKSYNPGRNICSCNSIQDNSKSVPQIKIKNEMLLSSGFKIGKEFEVIYQQGKIILILVDREENNL